MTVGGHFSKIAVNKQIDDGIGHGHQNSANIEIDVFELLKVTMSNLVRTFKYVLRVKWLPNPIDMQLLP